MRNTICSLVLGIKPYDNIEREHVESTLAWIKSDAPLFRIEKPDVPAKHFVSYAVLYDQKEGKILLVDHKKAELWLPTGGHVDLNEHPKDAAIREIREELGLEGEFMFDRPIFITVTQTVGNVKRHTDVSLWYVLKGDSGWELGYDAGEFNSLKWFDLGDIPYHKSDPHMGRFVSKLKEILNR